jgi:ATP-dependent Clp protease ATP-binding subunit ClpA
LEVVFAGLAAGTYVTGNVTIETPAWEAMRQAAFAAARERGHAEVTTDHLWFALLQVEGNETERADLLTHLETQLAALPVEADVSPKLSAEARTALKTAYETAKAQKSDLDVPFLWDTLRKAEGNQTP